VLRFRQYQYVVYLEKSTVGSVLEILLLLLLLVGAGVIFLPEILKERALDSPVDTISDFKRGMTVLATSTHNQKPSAGRYYASVGGDPEPYVRRSHYTDRDDFPTEDFIPYPSNKARAEMETRRSRIIALLLVITLATGILAIIPSIRWIIPLHIAMLLILAIYIGLVILLPHYDRHR
jgi:hypothetical protein